MPEVQRCRQIAIQHELVKQRRRRKHRLDQIGQFCIERFTGIDLQQQPTLVYGTTRNSQPLAAKIRQLVHARIRMHHQRTHSQRVRDKGVVATDRALSGCPDPVINDDVYCTGLERDIDGID
jgi:hypothetical protein